MFQKSNVRSKLLRVSSHDRIDLKSNTSAFTVDIPSLTEGLSRLVGTQLLSAKIPNLFYNVDVKDLSEADPVLQLSYNGADYNLTIPRGQYVFNISTPPSNDLIQAIKTEFFNETGATLDVAVDPVTLRLTFSHASNPLSMTESNFNNSTGDLPQMLGFRLPRPTALPTNVLEAETIYDLSGVNDVYIHCKQLALQSIDLDTQNSISLVGSIDIDSVFGSVSHYEIGSSHASMLQYPNERYVSELDIRLRDSKGRLTNLNNFDWTCIFKIYYLV
jgi:hypothetical protein